jgi:hypothetical protein
MRLHPITLAGLIFILTFGGISFASAMNWWQTESEKVPVKFTEGEASGQYNPADIRGSYTFGDVSQLFDIPLTDLQLAFHIPADSDPAAYQLKSLEEQNADMPEEIGTGSVRLFVAFYKGLPFDIMTAEDTYLFPEAVSVLEQQGKLTEVQLSYVKSHTTSSRSAPEAQITASPETPFQSEATEHIPEEYLVTGKTSFQNLLDWGVPQATIETILGEKLPATQVLVKDYASSKGITFSELKAKLQTEVDQYK